MTVRDLSLSQAALAYGGTLMYPDCQFNRVSTDSRTLSDGDLFVALRGDNFDAHRFLEQVSDRACGFVVEAPDKQLDLPQWVVPDTTLALGELAALAREQFEDPLIAITGSSGKTTVKEMVASIFSCAMPVLATRGNLNNHIGVPLTLLELGPEHRCAVIEMGASAAGEIAYLTRLARPTIAVVTNILAAHIEGFGSLAGVASAKQEIYGGLGPSGTAVLNLDEPWAEQWQLGLACQKTVTFSLTKQAADVYASDIHLDAQACASFTLNIATAGASEGQFNVQLSVAGRHNVNNALAGAACAVAAGMDAACIIAGLESLVAVTGRMEYRSGLKQCRVIDDSYNANPGSVNAAIDVLAGLQGPRVLVLGGMAELGADADKLHREVGEYAKSQGIEALFATGELCAHVVAGFGEGARLFADKNALLDALLEVMNPAVTVLVKGSRSAGMDQLVKQITVEEGA